MSGYFEAVKSLFLFPWRSCCGHKLWSQGITCITVNKHTYIHSQEWYAPSLSKLKFRHLYCQNKLCKQFTLSNNRENTYHSNIFRRLFWYRDDRLSVKRLRPNVHAYYVFVCSNAERQIRSHRARQMAPAAAIVFRYLHALEWADSLFD